MRFSNCVWNANIFVCINSKEVSNCCLAVVLYFYEKWQTSLKLINVYLVKMEDFKAGLLLKFIVVSGFVV